MSVRGIILLEGADASGKTTLARYLVDRYGGRYLHSTVHRPDEIWRWHAGAIRLAIRLAADRLVVMDRHWPSEQIYGPIFRGGPGYDGSGARCFDRILRRFGAVYVYCAPADQEGQVRRWEAGRAAGKREHFDSVREVIARYYDLAYGNVARPGNEYLDQLTRFGDLLERDDTMVYDLDRYRSPRGVAAFAALAIGKLLNVQRSVVPYVGSNLAGRLDPRLPGIVIVGEAPSPRTKSWSPKIPLFPWVDKPTNLGAAAWLNHAIHHLALREDRIAYTNANGDGDYLGHLLALMPPRSTTVALGLVAHEKVRSVGGRAHLIAHPQWHRRFKYPDGPAGYAALLAEAIRVPIGAAA